NGKRAGDAMAFLLGVPDQSVAFLKDRLHPAEAVDEKRLAQMLADLNAEGFETREAASRQLALLGEQVEAKLGQTLKEHASVEVARRVKEVLENLEGGLLPLETRRALRAVEVLEQLGTPEAVRSLKVLAKGAPEARQTCDVKRALGRLAERR